MLFLSPFVFCPISNDPTVPLLLFPLRRHQGPCHRFSCLCFAARLYDFFSICRMCCLTAQRLQAQSRKGEDHCGGITALGLGCLREVQARVASKSCKQGPCFLSCPFPAVVLTCLGRCSGEPAFPGSPSYHFTGAGGLRDVLWVH